MELTFAPRGILQIDDARITYKNFEGRGDKFNREGDRNFALIIPTQEIADALLDDKNDYGVSWNVKIKAPRNEGDDPFIYLPVKVRFTERGPIVYLKSGRNRQRLTDETIEILDKIAINYIRMDIRPYDDVINGKPFRAAYLHSMEVVQEIDRFTAEYAAEEFPTE